MKPTPAQKVYDKLRAERNDDGVAYVANKDVATLVRAHLKRTFPGVKFSVRSNDLSVDVHWTDGPPQSAVNSEISQYKFGGFDGMIDMAYSSTNWLLSDGTMESACSEGTTGSMGVCQGYATDCPQPGAIMVKGGPKYVDGQKTLSDERLRQLVDEVAEITGQVVDHEKPYWDQVIDGEYLTTLAWQRDQHLYEKANS